MTDRMHRGLPIVLLAGACIAPSMAGAQSLPDRHATGLIWWVDRGAITLQNHRTVFLKHGTRIEPRGLQLTPGQRIIVQGEDAANGNLNATAIRILGKSTAVTPGFGSWYGGRDDLVAARRSPSASARSTPRQQTHHH